MTVTTGRGRIDALDVLRGVAILGTFGTNVWLFAEPGGPAAWISTAFAEGDPLGSALHALTNGKFLALLTLLFGVGIELQYRSAVRRGNPWPGRYPVRAAILFVEGLVHYVLVFEFDVLMGYAIASVLVAYLVGRSDRAVRAWAGAAGAVYVAVLLAVTGLLLVTPDASASGSAPDPALTASWPRQVQLRLEYATLFRAELLLIVPSAVVLFLVGSRLVRAGAFTEAGAPIRRRLMVVGLGAGVPLNALVAAAGPDWFLVDRYLAPPLVALGLLGLGTTLVQRARRGPARSGAGSPRSAARRSRATSCRTCSPRCSATAGASGWRNGSPGQARGSCSPSGPVSQGSCSGQPRCGCAAPTGGRWNC
jgi:uncharacterized protein